MRAPLPLWFGRWFAEPHQLVVTVVAFSVLLSLGFLFGHRMMSPRAMTADELAKAHSGVIVLKTDDPRECKEVKFNNETGTFGSSLSTACDKRAAHSDDGQFGSIRDALRHR